MVLPVQESYSISTVTSPTADFPFSFNINFYTPEYKDRVCVYKNDVKVPTDQYIVVTNNPLTGGTMHFVTPDDLTPIVQEAGTVVTIYRVVPMDQNLVLDDFAPFPANAMEGELDKLTMITQDLDAKGPILDDAANRAKESAEDAKTEADRAEAEADRAESEANKAAQSASGGAQSEAAAEQAAADAHDSAVAASSSAQLASISETNAATSATEAATSATEAQGFRDEAEVIKTETEATYTEFQDEYWGEYYWDTSTPAPNLNPKTDTVPNIGDLFFNTFDSTMYVCAATTPYKWVDTGTTGVSQMIAGQNIELSPADGKGVVRVKATATGDVDEVVIGNFEGTLLYNQPIPKEDAVGKEIIYRNGDYFVFIGPDGDRTVPPVGYVRTGDYCICTTGTKGPQDDFSILEDQIQHNAADISDNNQEIKQLEGSEFVGSTVVRLDGGSY